MGTKGDLFDDSSAKLETFDENFNQLSWNSFPVDLLMPRDPKKEPWSWFCPFFFYPNPTPYSTHPKKPFFYQVATLQSRGLPVVESQVPHFLSYKLNAKPPSPSIPQQLSFKKRPV